MGLNGITDHIWSRDPALKRDDEAVLDEALEHHRRTGDASQLPLVEGRHPAIWKIKSLTDAAYTSMVRFSQHKALETFGTKDFLNLAARALYPERKYAAARGLVGVEGCVDGEGRPLRIEFAPGDESALTEATLARLHKISPLLIAELGLRVISMTERVDPT